MGYMGQSGASPSADLSPSLCHRPSWTPKYAGFFEGAIPHRFIRSSRNRPYFAPMQRARVSIPHASSTEFAGLHC
jgi:hypothetical protein